MADISAAEPKPALGVGAIVSESFSILFGNFFKVIITAFVPTLIGFLISGILIGFGPALGVQEPQFDSVFSILANILSPLIDMVIYSITTALLIQLAYDAKLNRPISIGRYFGPALSSIAPLAILSIVATFLAALGFVFFVVPGIWIYGVFAVMAPAVVIERAGFGGLGRSARLTKEYRWPIIGAFLLALVCAVLINVVSLLVVGLITGIGGVVGMVISVIIFAGLSAIGAGLISIVTSLIYARLREIKEGVSVDQIAAVFD
ncbi:hypothetical protein FMN50_14620 [Rhodobacterales bacterium]|nr:hypothetical protein FMN50_14620 [Rhodobacterales bacterium]